MTDLPDPLPLAQALLRCPSLTGEDRGAQAVLAAWLAARGFSVRHLPFGETPNLLATSGDGGAEETLCFSGHTDVVPPGPGWRVPPFAGTVEDGILYGRGACDMKGGIAAFAAAAAAYQNGGGAGTVSLAITGDEEGPATDGSVRLAALMRDEGAPPRAVLVGEPTSAARFGDTVKIGRRGSLNALITASGVQGHAAYPERADNPLHRLLPLLAALAAAPLDEGTPDFAPSALQVTSVDVGNAAFNVIPGEATARLNIRFNDRHSGAGLERWLRARVAEAAPAARVDVTIGAEPFLTEGGGRLTGALRAAVRTHTGLEPRLDTGGGTSDARFFAPFAEVAEFGLVGRTMHAVDECVPVAELRALAAIYLDTIRAWHA